jgi:hypothetical protein
MFFWFFKIFGEIFFVLLNEELSDRNFIMAMIGQSCLRNSRFKDSVIFTYLNIGFLALKSVLLFFLSKSSGHS